ncbi:MAG: substrate-binding domain-containing protein [Chloroflexota bacterium]|nr:substrate-binding domain-containing protein [Chloroflexota bacterium]
MNLTSILSYSRRVRLLVTVSMLTMLIASCTSAPTPIPPSATPEPYTFGMALADSNAFFSSMAERAQQTADRLGVTLDVQFASNDAAAQMEQVAAMIAAGVDALLINPVDSAGIGASVAAANAAGIPVFTVDRSAGSGEVVAHIASDNAAGGEMAGDYLAEALGEQGSIIELRGIEGTSAAQGRGEGFNRAIATHDGITVIASETANFNAAEGETVFAALLEQYPDIDGVFAHNDDMILGAIEAARAAGRLETIRFVGFDAIDDAITALESGDLLATIAQQPTEMGRLSVETALAHLNGERVSPNIMVDLALVTR